MSVIRGTSFQWDEGSGVEHTWVVATHVCEDQHVLISLSSIGKKPDGFIDKTCILDPRKVAYHKVTENSYAFYARAQVKTTLEIKDLLAINTINNHMPCWLVDTIASGLMKSGRSSVRAKNLYRKVKL